MRDKGGLHQIGDSKWVVNATYIIKMIELMEFFDWFEVVYMIQKYRLIEFLKI